MTAAPYECLEPDHWIFAGTGLTKGATFGADSMNERIPGGASGHETDKISPSSPANVQLLAKGLVMIKALSFCCASTAFPSKTVPFRAVGLSSAEPDPQVVAVR
eukprot:SAG22_NODE_8196_length_675_cov_1.501736_1_plen_104_part_00